MGAISVEHIWSNATIQFGQDLWQIVGKYGNRHQFGVRFMIRIVLGSECLEACYFARVAPGRPCNSRRPTTSTTTSSSTASAGLEHRCYTTKGDSCCKGTFDKSATIDTPGLQVCEKIVHIVHRYDSSEPVLTGVTELPGRGKLYFEPEILPNIIRGQHDSRLSKDLIVLLPLQLNAG